MIIAFRKKEMRERRRAYRRLLRKNIRSFRRRTRGGCIFGVAFVYCYHDGGGYRAFGNVDSSEIGLQYLDAAFQDALVKSIELWKKDRGREE